MLASTIAAGAGVKGASAADFMVGMKLAEQEEESAELAPNAFFDLVEAKAKPKVPPSATGAPDAR